MRKPLPALPLAALALATLSTGCRDAGTTGPGPAAGHVAVAPQPSPTPVPPARPPQPLEALQAAHRPPVELYASAIPGHLPLPTYRARVRNACDRPVRRVIATVVYRDEAGRALPGEKHDVAFGSPLKAIDPGVTLETKFLSRVEHAPGVRLVVRSVTFLETGTGAGPVPREWQNPRYDADLAEAEGGR